MYVAQIIAKLCAGGAESFLVDLAIAQRDQGHRVAVYLIMGSVDERGRVLEQRLRDAGIPVVVEGGSVKSPRSLLHLSRWLRRERPDVIHAHLPASEILVPLALLGSSHRPALVRTLHETFFPRTGWRPRALRVLGGNFDATIGCSQPVEASYRSSAVFSPRSPATYIENGIGFPEAAPPSPMRRHAGGPIEFLMIGAFRGASLATGSKGHDVALRAFARALEGNPDLRLTMAGGGPLLGEAKALANALKLGDRVRFLGIVPDARALLASHDALLMPSRYEGLPIVVLEAAGAGCPIVASDIPEIRSHDAGYGWHYASSGNSDAVAQAMLECARDIEGAAQKARSIAPSIRERFSIARCAQRYLALYADALGKRRTALA